MMAGTFLSLAVVMASSGSEVGDVVTSALPTVDQLMEIEQRIIDGRRELRTGRVVVRNKTTVRINDPRGLGVPKVYETYFDGETLRADYSVGTHKSQTISTPDVFIQNFSDEEITCVFGPDTRPSGSTGRPPDPRRLGIVVWFYDTINNHGYEEVFLNPNREDFRVTAGEFGDKPVWKVTFRFSSADELVRHAEYWLCPDQGCQPVYVGIVTGDGSEKIVASVTSELREYASVGLWYPKEVVFRISRDGNLTNEEVVIVEDAAFDQDVPKQMFALAGLDLPVGKVIRFDSGELGVWDGSHAVKSEPAIEPDPSAAPRRVRRVLAMAAALGLALLGVLLWRRRLDRRR